MTQYIVQPTGRIFVKGYDIFVQILLKILVKI